MTQKELDSLNNLQKKCENGFRLDKSQYMFHKEKNLYKIIPIEGSETVLKVTICFFNEYTTKKAASGQKFNVATGLYEPHIWYNLYSGSITHGLGHHIAIGEAVKRKSSDLLAKLTKDYTDEKCMEIWEQIKHTENPLA